MEEHEICLDYGPPTPYLDEFKGKIHIGKKGCVANIPLNINNFVCKGTVLRNVDYIIGVTVYTGHHTKIMLNSSKSRAKQSQIERNMNKQIVMIVFF